jgi:hypothetical protein
VAISDGLHHARGCHVALRAPRNYRETEGRHGGEGGALPLAEGCRQAAGVPLRPSGTSP